MYTAFAEAINSTTSNQDSFKFSSVISLIEALLDWDFSISLALDFSVFKFPSVTPYDCGISVGCDGCVDATSFLALVGVVVGSSTFTFSIDWCRGNGCDEINVGANTLLANFIKSTLPVRIFFLTDRHFHRSKSVLLVVQNLVLSRLILHASVGYVLACNLALIDLKWTMH